ncbi:MAG: hypothetical protein ACFCUW_08825 [Kiloniellaceae bacterium]
MVSSEEMQALLDRIDGTGSEDDRAARKALVALDLGVELPKHLLPKYRRERKLDARIECLRLSIRYSQESEEAFQMAIEALGDRSATVVHLACVLLSFSLRKDALPALRILEATGKTENRRDYARRAIDAVEHENPHYYLDTKHTGKAFLTVGPDRWPLGRE